MSKTEVDIGKREINLLAYWKEQGYREEKGYLIKDSQIKTVSTKNVTVSRMGAIPRRGVALKKIFGKNIEKTTHIKIRGDRIIPIVRTDKRVELTQFDDIKIGDTIKVELTTITEKDRIKIEDIDYEPYITGEYKQRTINIKGKLRMIIGIKPPKTIKDINKFWNNIYEDARDYIHDDDEEEGEWLNSFIASTYAGDAPEGSDFSDPEWRWRHNHTKGNFPNSKEGLENTIKKIEEET